MRYNGWFNLRLNVDDLDSLTDGYIKIYRQEFEIMATKLLKSIMKTIQEALMKCQHEAKTIDRVLYVGGGSRMPMIKKLLKDLFPNSEHCCEEHPDEVVAIGAAYYAYSLKINKETKNQCSVI